MVAVEIGWGGGDTKTNNKQRNKQPETSQQTSENKPTDQTPHEHLPSTTTTHKQTTPIPCPDPSLQHTPQGTRPRLGMHSKESKHVINNPCAKTGKGQPRVTSIDTYVSRHRYQRRTRTSVLPGYDTATASRPNHVVIISITRGGFLDSQESYVHPSLNFKQ